MAKTKLSLAAVYSISTGASLGSGFFLLPGLIADQIGVWVILAFLVAAVPLIPALAGLLELSTALPKSGGAFYFIDRCLGPLAGTVSGFGSWILMVFKIAFILTGIGIYLRVLFPDVSLNLIVVPTALMLVCLNFFDVGKSAFFQIILVSVQIFVLVVCMLGGLFHLDTANFAVQTEFESPDFVLATGTLFMSYIGLTKIVGLAGEVDNPEKNLKFGMIFSLITAILIYCIGTVILVGAIPPDVLYGSKTPMFDLANIVLGKYGGLMMVFVAGFSFLTAANATMISASRVLHRMGQDGLLHKMFGNVNRYNSPYISVLATGAMAIFFAYIFDVISMAKMTGVFQFLIFIGIGFSVIIMRESEIDSYDPGYRSPFYPWLQILGVLMALYFIFNLGFLPMVFIFLIVIFSTWWFNFYGRNNTSLRAVVFHWFEKMGKHRSNDLESEFREILRDKGMRSSDLYNDLILHSNFYEAKPEETVQDIFTKAAIFFSDKLNIQSAELLKKFMDGNRIGATPVVHGAALPHMRIEGMERPELFIVRCRQGLALNDLQFAGVSNKENELKIHAFFFLVSPLEEPAKHLRILSGIAVALDKKNFIGEWNNLRSEAEIQNFLIKEDNVRKVPVSGGGDYKDCRVMDLHLPENCVIAFITRKDSWLIPKGNTVVQEGDILTVIGEKEALQNLDQYNF